MALKLMYITNKPEVARIAEDVGVDWIFIDMEFIGKDSRQGGLDTVQNHHTVEDVRNIKKAISKSELLVRVNPIHEALPNYPSSKDEISSEKDEYLLGTVEMTRTKSSLSICLSNSWNRCEFRNAHAPRSGSKEYDRNSIFIIY